MPRVSRKMLMKPGTTADNALAPKDAAYSGLFLALSLIICLIAFAESLLELIHRWSLEEQYSHGFLIPIIVAWLLWARRDALLASIGRPSWFGLAIILLAGCMLVVGKMTALFLLAQVGFVIVLIGIVVATGGLSLLK